MNKSEEYWGFPLSFSNCYRWGLVEDWKALRVKETHFQWLFVMWRHQFPMSQLRRSNSTLVLNVIHPLDPLACLEAHGKKFCLSTIDRGHDGFCLGCKFQTPRFVCRHYVLYQHVADLWLLRVIVFFSFIAQAMEIRPQKQIWALLCEFNLWETLFMAAGSH